MDKKEATTYQHNDAYGNTLLIRDHMFLSSTIENLRWFGKCRQLTEGSRYET